MKVVDTFPSFPNHPTIENLKEYHQAYPNIFEPYFSYHCQNTDERLEQAIKRYADDWPSIQKVHHMMIDLLEEVQLLYQTIYQLHFPIAINLMIGAYGSNAYTEREVVPDITFAMERLTSEKDPLRVIIAHEFGHVAHGLISRKHPINWQTMEWGHPYIWLLQEGAATHFSKQIVPNLTESIYFSYDDHSDDWLAFAKAHHEEIIRCFAKDINRGKSAAEIFQEWFSIRGGSTFGFSRLAYYIADCFFQDVLHQIGEVETLLLWKDNEIFQMMEEWLGE